jgi:polyphosphate kinase 2 (PPK2 family)
MTAPRMADFDPSPQVARAGYKRERRRLQLELLRMQIVLRDERECGVAIVFEGVDAAGKGGAISRLTGRLDPRGFIVHSIGAPVGRERREHYLQRFHTRMPARGELVIFDRSWYGRLLVERVEGLASADEWERAYREIAEFERLYADSGVALLKIWLQVTKQEQLRRFEQRASDPFKRYKLTDEDWRNRERWDDYMAAADEMFERTHSEAAPWLLVSGEHKRHARLAVLSAVLDRWRIRMGAPA